MFADGLVDADGSPILAMRVCHLADKGCPCSRGAPERQQDTHDRYEKYLNLAPVIGSHSAVKMRMTADGNYVVAETPEDDTRAERLAKFQARYMAQESDNPFPLVTGPRLGPREFGRTVVKTLRTGAISDPSTGVGAIELDNEGDVWIDFGIPFDSRVIRIPKDKVAIMSAILLSLANEANPVGVELSEKCPYCRQGIDHTPCITYEELTTELNKLLKKETQ